MMKSKRRTFTLLECLLVLFLLGGVAFLVGIKIKGSKESEQFKGATHALVDRLRLSQELMMLGSDVTLKMIREGDFYKLHMVPMQGADEMNFSLIKKGNTLKGIDDIRFTGDDVELSFVSKGCRMPKGSLILSRGSEEREIKLPGYPSFIRLHDHKPQRELLFTSEELYPHL